MQRLVDSIKSLKTTHVAGTVDERMRGFRALGCSGQEEIFKELCFCILTANYSAEGGIRIQKAIGLGFLTFDEPELASELKRLGYRFPNMRAKYIVQARTKQNEIKMALASLKGRVLRGWFAENILGLGYKEASHFLRNIGHKDYAIIDFHIVDILCEHGLIEKPKSKSLSKNRYIEIETRLFDLAERCGITQGELDLYLWYMETGKILK